VRVGVASARGIVGGWILKATLPLLVSPQAIAEWTAAGVGDRARIALAVVELLGAALFAFEWSAVAGFILLALSFSYAAIIHIQRGELPWWLGGYLVASAILIYWTRISASREAAVQAIR
jgi:hypothetical protein